MVHLDVERRLIRQFGEADRRQDGVVARRGEQLGSRLGELFARQIAAVQKLDGETVCPAQTAHSGREHREDFGIAQAATAPASRAGVMACASILLALRSSQGLRAMKPRPTFWPLAPPPPLEPEMVKKVFTLWDSVFGDIVLDGLCTCAVRLIVAPPGQLEGHRRDARVLDGQEAGG